MRSWIRKFVIAAAIATPGISAYAADPNPLPLGPVNLYSNNGPLAPVNSSVNGEAAVILEDRVTPMLGDSGFTLTPEGERFSVRGWLNGGYVYNAGNPRSHFNGPYNSVYLDQGQFNQAYMIAEYLLPRDGSFGVGGRVDALYGNDFLLGQSVGLEVNPNGTRKWNNSIYYGVAIPQAYGQIGTEATNVKVGHFYSVVGYEGVQANGNFFYSKSYSYQFAGPFTHWGVLGSHQLTDNLQLVGGAHMGWDVLDTVEDNVSFIGGVKYVSPDKAWWSSFMVTSGDSPTNLAGNPQVQNGFSNRTRYSFIVDANLSECLEYVFHQWLGFQVDGAPNAPPNGGGAALWYGIDQYVYYKVNNCVKVGGRFEWFRDEDGTRVGLTLPANPNRAPLPGSYYSGALGINYTPISNLTVRPEARYDFATDTVRNPYNDGTRNNQFMLGVDAIFRY